MRARCAGSAWEILAPAKLNLYLEILGRRDDGFHELETLMTPVRIYDQLRWAPAPQGEPAALTLDYHGATHPDFLAAAPPDSTNLVWRAFDLLARTAGIEPTGRATLAKRIPVQAGLGGASSNAAAALLLANRAWGIHYPLDRLAELAARLGSDVPFFLAGGAAICRGRGEQVTPLGPLPRLHVVVVKPPAGVSTAAAFAALDAAPLSPDAGEQSRTRLARLVDTLRSGASVAAARHLSNRLEPVAERLCPWIARVRHALAQCGALGWMMTGSGSACFAVMRSARHARTAARRVAAGLADQAITDHSAKHDTERPGDPEAPPARAARKDARQTMRDLAVPMMGNRGTVFATATCHAACPPL